MQSDLIIVPPLFSGAAAAAMTLAHPALASLRCLHFHFLLRFMSFRRRMPHTCHTTLLPAPVRGSLTAAHCQLHLLVSDSGGLTSCPCCCALQLLISKEPLIKSFCTSTMRNAFTGRTICQQRKRSR